MIPTKMLVYRGPDGGTQTISNTRRRKKSTGELFQKGYRVRMGHGHVADKEDQDSICYSFGACVHVISYWGKTCRMWEPGWGESPLKLNSGVSRTLWTLCQLEQVQDSLCIMLHLANAWHEALARQRRISFHTRWFFLDLFLWVYHLHTARF